MGIKGMTQIIVNLNERINGVLPTKILDYKHLSIDISCIFFKCSKIIIPCEFDDAIYFTFLGKSINLTDTINEIIDIVGLIPNVNEITFCFDGLKRPILKYHECKKRCKTQNNFYKIVKKSLNSHQLITILKTEFEKKYSKINFYIADMEADIAVSKYNKILTMDSDIIMLALFKPNISLIYLLQRRYSNLVEIEINEKVKMFRNQLFLYSIIAGNDYLPTLYHCKDPIWLFNFLEDCSSIKDAYLKIFNKIKPKVKYTSEEDVKNIVNEWMNRVKNYFKYVKYSDQKYLCYGNKKQPEITSCEKKIVKKYIMISSFNIT